MAIAFDAASSGSAASGTTVTVAHTCTGTNLILLVATRNDANETTSGITYAGVSMTQVPTVSPKDFHSGPGNITMWYLFAPATGANNIVATCTTITSVVVRGYSLTGAKQSGFPDASSNANSLTNVGGLTTSTTVVASDCWVSSYFSNNSGAGTSAGAGAFLRSADASNGWFDSNGTVATGAYSMTVNNTGTAQCGMISVSIAPSVAATSGKNFLAFM